MKKNIIILLLTTFVLLSCNTHTINDKRVITVSIEPLRFFTEQIAGDRFEINTMVKDGANPETYEPTAQQMVDLAHSDIFIKIGGIGFEHTWMNKFEANAPHTIIINSSNGINYEKSINGINDPHTWMSCTNAIKIAQNIYHSLASIDGKDSTYFKQNLDILIDKIKNTDNKIRQNLTKDKTPIFLIYHPILTYYAKEYNLTQIPLEEEGREPSPSQIQYVITLAKTQRVKTIFTQKQFSNRNTEIVERSTGVKSVEINPLSYDWCNEMIKISTFLK